MQINCFFSPGVILVKATPRRLQRAARVNGRASNSCYSCLFAASQRVAPFIALLSHPYRSGTKLGTSFISGNVPLRIRWSWWPLRFEQSAEEKQDEEKTTTTKGRMLWIPFQCWHSIYALLPHVDITLSLKPWTERRFYAKWTVKKVISSDAFGTW